MKNQRNISLTLLSIFAFATAVATIPQKTAKSRQKVTGCQGTLIANTCESVTVETPCNDTGTLFCDIDTSTQWWRYFSDNGCAKPLKRTEGC